MRRRQLLSQSGLWAASLLAPVAAGGTAARVRAAAAPLPDVPGEYPQDTFRQLFPNPTGENGYEEIVLAGVAARAAETRAAARAEPEPPYPFARTLTERRQYLNDRDVRRALSLLRQGLAKPIVSPHQNANFQTLFPDLSLVRTLARLLAVEQYVHLADGRTAAAIDSMVDGLRLARVISGTFLIGGLVGVAAEALVLTPIATYRDQFSVRDCGRLVTIARQFLESPDPLFGALEMERKTAIEAVTTALRGETDVVGLGVFVEDEEGNPDAEAQARLREIEALRRDPAALAEVTGQVVRRINVSMDRTIALHRDPSAAALPAEDARAGSGLAEFLADSVTPLYGNVSRRFAETRIRLQMVGVHAALRRHRWEYERLPDALKELRLKGLEIDPYTRQPFAYRRKDDGVTYDLASAGPLKQDEEGNPVPGQREAIVFPRPPAAAAAK